METLSLNRSSLAIAILASTGLALAGVEPWLAGATLLIWIGTLWLAKPEPIFESKSRGPREITSEMIGTMIEPMETALILIHKGRVEAANNAAREALGSHIMGQDIRVGLRHPEAIRLLTGEGEEPAVVKGLTTAKSLWKLSRFRIDADKELVELHDLSAQADISRAHTDFVANASHELRTPLASIVGYIETLGTPKAGGDPITRNKFLTTMGREAKRMNSLVEDLMSLSRIEAEKHERPQDRIDFGSIITHAVRDVNAVQGHERVKLDIDVEDAVIPGDRGQLDQLARNLIDNAIKYGDPEKPVFVTLVRQNGKSLKFSVRDEGQGIAAEHLPHLTRRFYRTDPGRSRASGGTGLGLAIVKHIAERHKGQLDIRSTVGVGSVVDVKLPVK